MAVPAPAIPFYVHHPNEINVCTIAVSIDGLLADLKPEHPLHGAQVEQYDGA